MIKASSQRKALKLLAEVDEEGNQVHMEVVCYKKVVKCQGEIQETIKLVCHSEAQILNFYKIRKPRLTGTEALKGDRKRHFAKGHRATYHAEKGMRNKKAKTSTAKKSKKAKAKKGKK